MFNLNSAELANKLRMLELINAYYSDANNLQNIYGRIAGTPTINNVPTVNNIVSGYIFDFSSHHYRNFQIYFHLNEIYKIFIRNHNDQGFLDWEQIYPDYSSISLQTNGYIVFNNGLILQWTRGSIATGESSVDVETPIAYPNRHIQAFSSISVFVSAGAFILQPFPSQDSAKHLNTIILQISPSVPSNISNITVLVVSFGW